MRTSTSLKELATAIKKEINVANAAYGFLALVVDIEAELLERIEALEHPKVKYTTRHEDNDE